MQYGKAIIPLSLLLLFPSISLAQDKGMHIFSKIKNKENYTAVKVRDNKQPKNCLAVTYHPLLNTVYKTGASFSTPVAEASFGWNSKDQGTLKTIFTPENFYIGGSMKKGERLETLGRIGFSYKNHDFRAGFLARPEENNLINAVYKGDFQPIEINSSMFFNDKIEKATIVGGYSKDNWFIMYCGIKKKPVKKHTLRIVNNPEVGSGAFDGAFKELSDPLGYIISEVTGRIAHSYGEKVLELGYQEINGKQQKYANFYYTYNIKNAKIHGAVGWGTAGPLYEAGIQWGPVYSHVKKTGSELSYRIDIFIGAKSKKLELH